MLWQGLRKAPDKVNVRVVKSKAPFAIRISNRVYRRAYLATLCIILVVNLGIVIGNSGSGRTVANANFMRGVGVGIYWDQGCTNRTLSVDWGLVEPGLNSTVIVYVRNEGDSAVSLWVETLNWIPSAASGYMTLFWIYPGRILNADDVIPMELILNVAPTISGITDFSFDTIITTTG